MSDFDEALRRHVVCDWFRRLDMQEMRRIASLAIDWKITNEEVQQIIADAKVSDLWTESMRKVNLEKKVRR